MKHQRKMRIIMENLMRPEKNTTRQMMLPVLSLMIIQQ
uniref:Uncharacterized protein n=1 Tax=Rhizophora mucronata TaxID=61149 RepID=A0A2P2N0P6_RHIMU